MLINAVCYALHDHVMQVKRQLSPLTWYSPEWRQQVVSGQTLDLVSLSLLNYCFYRRVRRDVMWRVRACRGVSIVHLPFMSIGVIFSISGFRGTLYAYFFVLFEYRSCWVVSDIFLSFMFQKTNLICEC